MRNKKWIPEQAVRFHRAEANLHVVVCLLEMVAGQPHRTKANRDLHGVHLRDMVELKQRPDQQETAHREK